MKKELIPKELLKRIARANANGKGYELSPGYLSCWIDVRKTLLEKGKITLNENRGNVRGLWLAEGVTVKLTPRKKTDKSTAKNKTKKPRVSRSLPALTPETVTAPTAEVPTVVEQVASVVEQVSTTPVVEHVVTQPVADVQQPVSEVTHPVA